MEFLLDILKRFTSRKFLLVVVGSLAVFGLELTSAQIAAITSLILAFTAAEGYADVTKQQYK